MVNQLLCFILLCLLGLAACKDEIKSCTGSHCVLDDSEGLHMLQMKGTRQTSKRQCPFPVTPSYLLYGKGCPEPGEVHDGHTCLNGNTEYTTLKEAWEACGSVPECSSIMEYSDHKYYLRRDSDPDLPANEGDYLLRYQCTHDQELQEQQRIRQEEEDRKQEALRQQKEDKVHEMETQEIRVSDDEHAELQEKFTSQSWAHYIEEGGLKDPQESPNEQINADVKQDITHDFSELFSQFSNIDCGYDEKDDKCNMDNQAFINDKMRNATDVSPDDVWAYCGRICEEAGTDCSGFTYKQGSHTCYFRKNTRCGIVQEWGSSCFTKKIARHADELKESRTSVLRDTEMHHSSIYEVTENYDCGYSQFSETCGMDNMAVINNGARNVTLVSPDEVFAVCGLICQEAGDACGGFVYKEGNASCHFRINATCGIYEEDGTTCYTKKSMLPAKKMVHAHKIPEDTSATVLQDAAAEEPAPDATDAETVISESTDGTSDPAASAPVEAAPLAADPATAPADLAVATDPANAPAEFVPVDTAEPMPFEPAEPVLAGP